MCPETISELSRFRFPRYKISLRRQTWILPEAQVARNCGTEIIQIPVRLRRPPIIPRQFLWCNLYFTAPKINCPKLTCCKVIVLRQMVSALALVWHLFWHFFGTSFGITFGTLVAPLLAPVTLHQNMKCTEIPEMRHKLPKVVQAQLLQAGCACAIFHWIRAQKFSRNWSNTVSGSTVSNTELSEFFGRITEFRGVRFQTPSSVSFLGLTEFRGANSVSSLQPIICVPKRTHRISRRTHRVCHRTQWVLSSETVLLKQYSARSLNLRVIWCEIWAKIWAYDFQHRWISHKFPACSLPTTPHPFSNLLSWVFSLLLTLVSQRKRRLRERSLRNCCSWNDVQHDNPRGQR